MKQVDRYKPFINIGCGLDIPGAFFVVGTRGETITMGGMPNLSAVVGGPNTFKSTLLHYMTTTAADRVVATCGTRIHTYDTEQNIHIDRLHGLASHTKYLLNELINDPSIWHVTDKANYLADVWYENIKKEYYDSKIKNAKDLMVKCPFSETPGGPEFEMIAPSFTQIDSFSEITTSDVMKLMEDNQLGDSGGNTIHMRQGLSKVRLIMEMPYITSRANEFVAITAHVGKEGPQMQTGPIALPPQKRLQHLKQGDKIKGVTDKFFFLLQSCWYVLSSGNLLDKDKEPKFPLEGYDYSLDLHLLSLKQLRSKSGASGVPVDIIVSQSQGVLEHLSLLNFLRESNNFGLDGNDRNYASTFLPDVKLQRTNVRGKLNKNPALRRAVEIAADMMQIYIYHPEMRNYIVSPQELYSGLTQLGYEWDTILNKTRNWWTPNETKYTLDTHFLSTMDLLKMLKGEYHPYWLEDDKKTIKEEYAKVNSI
jgi:hypothetical protein